MDVLVNREPGYLLILLIVAASVFTSLVCLILWVASVTG